MHNENKLIWVTPLLRTVRSAIVYACSWLSKFSFYVKNRDNDLWCGFVLDFSKMLRFSEKLRFYANYIPEQ